MPGVGDAVGDAIGDVPIWPGCDMPIGPRGDIICSGDMPIGPTPGRPMGPRGGDIIWPPMGGMPIGGIIWPGIPTPPTRAGPPIEGGIMPMPP